MKDKMIDVTGLDVKLFIQKVYDRSAPVGLGHLHYVPGIIPEDLMEKIYNQYLVHVDQHRDSHEMEWARSVLNMDYVCGRCCKMNLFMSGEDLLLRPYWADHSAYQYEELLKEIGFPERVDEIDRTYDPR